MVFILQNLKNKFIAEWKVYAFLLVGILGFGLSSQLRAQTVSDTGKALNSAESTVSGSEKTVGYSTGSPASGIEDVALSLAIVLILIFVLAWLVKRFAPGAGRVGSKHMQVLSTLPLEGKERLVLVDIAGTQMVLGISSERVECLHVFPDAVIKLSADTGENASFANILQGFKTGREKG
ncbi:flagellar biosynthetic protein FliO [Oceanospirillum linum]|uniref:Flagellar protein n=1 Tax=Oceanospirillum linum TaxID=966 RepID=A0A1T1HFB0_OCELI|nr:flagellar biosynthetic protein FliO [Oceanospirillum linum]OOV88568.1 flagellar biosynthetic protein FliO [Oceanospirillum linum]SEF61168.1 flagellar biosynthetic protein FliO [Oleiphilus messinensis]SMP07092.1 flagellar biosynthetic protein FliO [Oceanospirillum linum]